MESKINRIVDIVHQLREEGGGIANSLTSPSDGKGYIAGTKEAGDNPPVDLRKHNKWNPFFKDLAKMQRRKPQP
jgi:hypothetical protein